jgi:hypothetical protein
LTKVKLLKKDALNIATKIGAIVDSDGPHQNASFYHGGLLIFEFGIRHGRKSCHGHLVGENKTLRLNGTQAIALARCNLSKEAYIQILMEKGVIPHLNENNAC